MKEIKTTYNSKFRFRIKTFWKVIKCLFYYDNVVLIAVDIKNDYYANNNKHNSAVIYRTTDIRKTDSEHLDYLIKEQSRIIIKNINQYTLKPEQYIQHIQQTNKQTLTN